MLSLDRAYYRSYVTFGRAKAETLAIREFDNASQDGTADLIASINDPRVVKRHFNKKNVNQYEPCTWFFETATSEALPYLV